jgi:methylated-DNA-protein-cysteine methyltransferase-like protein
VRPGFEPAVVAVLRSIPPGDVLTYGEVAAEAGHPGAARAVGRLLRTTDADVPWWRVVGAGGRLVTPDPRRQAVLLRAEGWSIRDRRLVSSREWAGDRRAADRQAGDRPPRRP